MKKLYLAVAAVSSLLFSCNSEKNHIEGKEKGKCPFGFDKGHKKEQITQTKSNKDWWPNKLDLDVLAQNSALSNPMKKDFNYADEFNKLDYAELKKDLTMSFD